MADRHAELLAMLRELKLPAVVDQVADLALKAAKANLTHEAFLYELVRAEVEQREQRRVARLLRRSGLPAEKTFRTLQLERFPPAVRQQVERLRSGAFANYRYRDELFPTLTFRRAYDALVSARPARADREYVRLLHLAASPPRARSRPP